jgi:hypothetical protein
VLTSLLLTPLLLTQHPPEKVQDLEVPMEGEGSWEAYSSDFVESLCVWHIGHGAPGTRKSCENVDYLGQIVILREEERKRRR